MHIVSLKLLDEIAIYDSNPVESLELLVRVLFRLSQLGVGTDKEMIS